MAQVNRPGDQINNRLNIYQQRSRKAQANRNGQLNTVANVNATGKVRQEDEFVRSDSRNGANSFTDVLNQLNGARERATGMSEQLGQAAKLATMGELAASIAHELNNPLATVSLRVESLMGQVAKDDPKRRALEVIEQETDRMGKLVANLLQFTRGSQPQISTVDVREEIDNTLELIDYRLRRQQIDVVQEFAPDVPMIHADSQQLRQVFLNVLTNAGDAMPDGGTLTIRTEADDTSTMIEFSDTGGGIPAENLARVREPFFTTKAEDKGTGLGLAISQRIVQEHHGTLDIFSEAGKGTTVRIGLPITNGANTLI